jgi:hypothetical protein
LFLLELNRTESEISALKVIHPDFLIAFNRRVETQIQIVAQGIVDLPTVDRPGWHLNMPGRNEFSQYFVVNSDAIRTDSWGLWRDRTVSVAPGGERCRASMLRATSSGVLKAPILSIKKVTKIIILC